MGEAFTFSEVEEIRCDKHVNAEERTSNNYQQVILFSNSNRYHFST